MRDVHRAGWLYIAWELVKDHLPAARRWLDRQADRVAVKVARALDRRERERKRRK